MGSLYVLTVFKGLPLRNKNNERNPMLDRASPRLSRLVNSRRAVNEKLWLRLVFHSKWAINFLILLMFFFYTFAACNHSHFSMCELRLFCRPSAFFIFYGRPLSSKQLTLFCICCFSFEIFRTRPFFESDTSTAVYEDQTTECSLCISATL